MKTLTELYMDRFGPDSARLVIVRAGIHSSEGHTLKNDDERLVFALLEGLDFDCFSLGDWPTPETAEEVKAWLIENREAVLGLSIPAPSVLGLFAGVFDFLKAEAEDA